MGYVLATIEIISIISLFISICVAIIMMCLCHKNGAVISIGLTFLFCIIAIIINPFIRIDSNFIYTSFDDIYRGSSYGIAAISAGHDVKIEVTEDVNEAILVHNNLFDSWTLYVPSEG